MEKKVTHYIITYPNNFVGVGGLPSCYTWGYYFDPLSTTFFY